MDSRKMESDNPFLETFIKTLKKKEVQQWITFFMNEGGKRNKFINYFGVNYNEDELKSIKLYFSYFTLPSSRFFNQIGLNDAAVTYIKENWTSSKNYFQLHENVTFALKIYLNKNNITDLNFYAHFRSNKFRNQPINIDVTDDFKEKQGVSLEWNPNQKLDFRNYFYFTSYKDKKAILAHFNKNHLVNDLNFIEYTEWEGESKVNISMREAKLTYEYLKGDNNELILKFSNALFQEEQLYFSGIGIRNKSNTKALYFVTKNIIINMRTYSENSLGRILTSRFMNKN